MDNDIVLAFEDAAMEQAYQTTNSAQAKWQDIGAQMSDKFAPLFHLCDSLLSINNAELPIEEALFVQQMRSTEFRALSNDEQEPCFRLLSNHLAVIQAALSAELHTKLLRAVSKMRPELARRMSEEDLSADETALNGRTPTISGAAKNKRFAALRDATALFSKKNESNHTNPTSINFYLTLAYEAKIEDDEDPMQLEWAIEMSKFLVALTKCFHRKRVLSQHALVAGYMSDLFGVLYKFRKHGAEQEEQCTILEHHLKTLCRAANNDAGLNSDLPFVIANNLKAERHQSAPMLTCIANFSKSQTAFLTTNLQSMERQLFARVSKAQNVAE